MNSPSWVAFALAVWRVGAVLVPLNYRLQLDEILFLLDNAGIRILATEGDFHEPIRRVRAVSPQLAHVITFAAEAPPGWIAAPPGRAARAPRVPLHPLGEASLQRIMYTSGTTSRPKGVMVTHGMATWNILSQATELALTAEDRVLSSSPLYHVGALDAPALAALFVGGMLVVLRRFDADVALRLIHTERVTGTLMIQAMLHRVRHAAELGLDLSSLRWLIFGAAAGELYRDIRAAFPHTRLIQAYGLTEGCSAITYMDEAHALAKLGSAGTPVPLVEVRVVDDEDRDLPSGTPGEILVRSPKMTTGYWRDEAASAALLRGGWLHTGDVGVLDGDGYLYITDRKKDMIRSGGENVASLEIERVLYAHPDVKEAAVVGIPDAQWGEVPKAFIVVRDGATLDERAVVEHCRARLAGFKTPRRVEFLAELPRNPSGKVLKVQLRARESTR